MWIVWRLLGCEKFGRVFAAGSVGSKHVGKQTCREVSSGVKRRGKLKLRICLIYKPSCFPEMDQRTLIPKPDRPFRNSRASKCVDWWFWTTWNLPIGGFWGSLIVKGSVGKRSEIRKDIPRGEERISIISASCKRQVRVVKKERQKLSQTRLSQSPDRSNVVFLRWISVGPSFACLLSIWEGPTDRKCRASKLEDWQILCSTEKLIDGFQLWNVRSCRE